ncbi:hypothetical protein E2542_SST13055 [Spatholobus suberectus]|nr:hypothetical protein E2542_SST13055 [Spatholobus suberectus]
MATSAADVAVLVLSETTTIVTIATIVIPPLPSLHWQWQWGCQLRHNGDNGSGDGGGSNSNGGDSGGSNDNYDCSFNDECERVGDFIAKEVADWDDKVITIAQFKPFSVQDAFGNPPSSSRDINRHPFLPPPHSSLPDTKIKKSETQSCNTKVERKKRRTLALRPATVALPLVSPIVVAMTTPTRTCRRAIS